MVPFRVEHVPLADGLAYHLNRIHWIDALTPPLERHLEKLVRTVRAIEGASSATFILKTMPPTSEPVPPATDGLGARSKAALWVAGLCFAIPLCVASLWELWHLFGFHLELFFVLTAAVCSIGAIMIGIVLGTWWRTRNIRLARPAAIGGALVSAVWVFFIFEPKSEVADFANIIAVIAATFGALGSAFLLASLIAFAARSSYGRRLNQ